MLRNITTYPTPPSVEFAIMMRKLGFLEMPIIGMV